MNSLSIPSLEPNRMNIKSVNGNEYVITSDDGNEYVFKIGNDIAAFRDANSLSLANAQKVFTDVRKVAWQDNAAKHRNEASLTGYRESAVFSKRNGWQKRSVQTYTGGKPSADAVQKTIAKKRDLSEKYIVAMTTSAKEDGLI